MKTASVLLALLAVIPALALAFAPAPFPKPPHGGTRTVAVGKNVTLEVRGRSGARRVIVQAAVCLREGSLEHLLTRKTRKEHEAILAADVDARDVHAALLLAGAAPGSPARVNPKFTAASGSPLRITLEWQGGSPCAAQEWVRDIKSKKAMKPDWVFAGSQLVADPNGGRKHYLANDGDMICLANFETGMLDLPVRSSSSMADLCYEAFTENIPPVGTEVKVILEVGSAGRE